MLEYREVFGRDHIKLPADEWEDGVNNILFVVDQNGDVQKLDFDDIVKMVDRYFNTTYKATQTITHFNGPEVKKQLYYKEVYYG